MIRATVEFRDDVADAVAEFSTPAGARVWGEAMEELFPGARLMELEEWCVDHKAWEDYTPCVMCDFPCCDRQAIASCAVLDETLCDTCADNKNAEYDTALCDAMAYPPRRAWG